VGSGSLTTTQVITTHSPVSSRFVVAEQCSGSREDCEVEPAADGARRAQSITGPQKLPRMGHPLGALAYPRATFCGG
jgi:hypothetical protein